VYILGSFARRVTLYSQQVRALNLVFALQRANRLKKSTKVAVIGAGAAGITAAVAAVVRTGATVWVFDELQGPMELQQNNRQRWIHPFIYDWPYLHEFAGNTAVTIPPHKGDDANLPLLTWSADYAANVAQEIVSQWDYFRRLYDIKTRWNVEYVKIHRSAGKMLTVEWKNWEPRPEEPGRSKKETERFDLVILAVGFGLEPRGEDCDSYWIEDNLDAALRKPSSQAEWLVSGRGDGAFTDLMRLCFSRYRQDEILNLLTGAQGIDGVIRALRDMNTELRNRNLEYEKKFESRAGKRESLEAMLSNSFKNLPIDEELLRTAAGKLRIEPHMPNILLVTKGKHLYGPQTSVLNRLGVLVLEKLGEGQPRKIFQHIVGQTGRPKRDPLRPDKFIVDLKSGKHNPSRQFDRVLRRHGTKSVLKHKFYDIWRDAKELRSRWKEISKQELSTQLDETREPQWPSKFFDPEAKSMPPDIAETVAPEFAASRRRFGVWAKTLSIHKVVRSDGSSNITYTVEGLCVERKPLDGVYFYYKSATGIVDHVVCSSSTPGVRLSWKRSQELSSSRQTDISHSVENARRRARILSGIVQFRPSLKPDQQLDFSLSFRLVNGEAISEWDFSQMYSKEERRHIDDKPLNRAVEYLTRTVWFPVKTLRMRMTLPTAIKDSPLPGIFKYRNCDKIKRSSVLNTIHISKRSRRILRYYPAPHSRWREERVKEFHRRVCPPLDKNFFRSVSPQTWELSVPTPMVGSCYSLEWQLPGTDRGQGQDWDDAESLEQVILRDVRQFRKMLLHYRAARRGEGPKQITQDDVQVVRGYLDKLYDQLRDAVGAAKNDFAVSLMVITNARGG